ncbi:hypothetical protein F971_01987 [Acinetobacter vivianii]|uniref:Uncharacterized protein n=1 Tax=Acinetobacter vivianii TaxID=1776742 RepID=N8UXI8_9GAMM|nr:hypothetical protein [Acinetobacter vivianii]ENU92100.1 hypothetical protein F971_01987 [Acinetobacter vivianii]
MKQALKIKLANHSQFQQAWDALTKLGYHWGGNCNPPCTAPYLYSYPDGRILVDFFDVEEADLSSPNSAAGYFAKSEHKEITLDALLVLAKCDRHEPFYDYIPLIKKERPLFEANYVQKGGDLQYLKWDECDNGSGDYQPNWEEIGLIDHETSFDEHEFNENIVQHAEHVNSCLMSWVECAKSKAIPDGWILAPKEPNEKQSRTAMFITAQSGNAIAAYKAMLADLEVSSQ